MAHHGPDLFMDPFVEWSPLWGDDVVQCRHQALMLTATRHASKTTPATALVAELAVEAPVCSIGAWQGAGLMGQALSRVLVSVLELPADDWGWGGRTQAARLPR